MTACRELVRRWSERPSSFFPDWTKTVLEEALADAPQLRRCDFETFVQGSYANETNIHGDSDVDLVVQMRLPFEENIRALDVEERNRFYDKYGDTVYGWPQFRADVLARLRERYFVTEGRKCINIEDIDAVLRIPADIVPAIEYRQYSGFPAADLEIYEEGVFFRDSAGNPIINFPKQHVRNGRRKDANTGGHFKPMVRIFKNARNHCADVDSDDAPSYFVECLVYNIDDAVFRRPLHEAYPASVDWLHEHRDALSGFTCQNRLIQLFGDGGHQWRVDRAQHFIAALRRQMASC